MENNIKKPTYGCDSCYHYVEEEETGEYYCEVNSCIDEDDYAAFALQKQKKCPFYHYNDEYISVRKQI